MVPNFRRLFDQEAPAVLRRLRWLGVPERDRLDVAQDIFLDVARNLGRLDPSRDVRPWLVTVTCNRARDYHRRACAKREELGLDLDPASEGSAVDRLDARRTLQRYFDALSYEHREVLLLVELEEHSVPEAAELLGLKVKAVESRLLRAREALAAVAQRLQQAERRGASGPALLALPLDELVRAAREAPDEHLCVEVEQLRSRIIRALARPAPSLPRATTRAAGAQKAAESSEGDLIALARRALLEGDRTRALRLLRQHEAQYPQGVYQPERQALLGQLAGGR
jgi:RNA polymerase sigma factor CnrH